MYPREQPREPFRDCHEENEGSRGGSDGRKTSEQSRQLAWRESWDANRLGGRTAGSCMIW